MKRITLVLLALLMVSCKPEPISSPGIQCSEGWLVIFNSEGEVIENPSGGEFSLEVVDFGARNIRSTTHDVKGVCIDGKLPYPHPPYEVLPDAVYLYGVER